MELKDKIVLITGASRGLGLELARAYKAEGSKIITCARKFSDEIKKEFQGHALIEGNLVDEETQIALYEFAKTGIDILINNAGTFTQGPFHETNIADIELVFDVNVFSHIRLTRLIYPLMLQKKQGYIINIISTSGKNGKENQSIYCSTKFAMAGFTESLRHEAKKHGIKVFGIFPGGMKTGLFENFSVDTGNFMQPSNVAKIIISLSKTDSDVSPDEIIINRQWVKNEK
jgi:uncharacterized protein